MAEGVGQMLVIDTDGGGDDAAAILLALSKQSMITVLALTCCFGNTDINNACSNVLRILTLCKEHKISVYRGCAGPLIGDVAKDNVFGYDGFSNASHEFSTGDLEESCLPAPMALVKLARKYSNQIHLVTLGPLTNVAMAHKLDPRFTKNLLSIMCMGGNYKGIGNIKPTAEFNFYCDPESAHIVLNELECPVVLMPWETVLEFGTSWDVYDNLTKVDTAKGKFMKRINEYYVNQAKEKGHSKHYDADFLTVAALVYPKCVTNSIEGSVVVECDGIYTRGQAVLLRDSNSKKIKILTAFDEEILNNLRFQILQD